MTTERARRFARSLGVEHPLALAGMGLVSMPPLVAAVSEAGGFGVLGASPAPPPLVERWIGEIRGRTRRPFGANLIVDTLAFGPASTEAHVELLCRERVPVVTFHWNRPPAAWLERLHSAGAKVWMSVASAADAVSAAEAGFDAVVAQGAEAGGHNRSQLGLFALLPAVVDAVAPLPVLAAGGIGDGRGVAAALALGASAVSLGTRFVASDEANAHPEYQQRIVRATSGDVAATTIFGPEWPDQCMRVLRNRAVAGAERGGAPPSAPIGHTRLFGEPYELPPRSALLPTPETEGDLEQMCLAAGESVAAIHAVQPAGEIVAEIMADAAALLSGGGAPDR